MTAAKSCASSSSNHPCLGHHLLLVALFVSPVQEGTGVEQRPSTSLRGACPPAAAWQTAHGSAADRTSAGWQLVEGELLREGSDVKGGHR